jgi:diguanylate cyclase (GGDEF)-like protein
MSSPKSKILAIITSYYFKLGAVLLVVAPMAIFAADYLYPPLMAGQYQAITNKLAAEAKSAMPTPPEVLQLLNQHNLAWYYITDSDSKVLPPFKYAAPDLDKIGNNSRTVQWRDCSYYEATATADAQKVLHVGFHTGPFAGVYQKWHSWDAVLPVSLAMGFSAIFLIVIVALFEVTVRSPLRKLHEFYMKKVANPSMGSVELRLAASEISGLPAVIDSIVEAAKEPLLNEIAAARNDIQDYVAKEVEDRIIAKLTREIETVNSSNRIAHIVLHKIQDEYPALVKFALSYQAVEPDARLNAFMGFNPGIAEKFCDLPSNNNARQAVATNQTIMIGGEELKDPCFQRLPVEVDYAFMMPLACQGRILGLMTFFCIGDKVSMGKVHRVLKKVADLVSKTLYRVTVYEEEFAANRTDALTGLPNRKYLVDSMPTMFDRLSPDKRFVAVIVEGDNFMALNDKYGRQAGDQLIQELAKTVKDAAKLRDQGVGGEFGDKMFRYGAAQFVILLEDVDKSRALTAVDRIRSAVEAKHDWPQAVPAWTCSAGIACYPEDSRRAEELLVNAEIALTFLKKQKNPNKIFFFDQVPKQHRPRRAGVALGGTLDVFDPAALLQSMTTARNTGILEVWNPQGLRLWAYLEEGRIMKAKLGKISGDAAVIQFVCTFEEGDFNFRELTPGSESKELEGSVGLDRSFDVVKNTDKLLMEAMLAIDNLAQARAAIPRTNLYVLPEPGTDKPAVWEELSKVPDPPTADEVRAMSEIFRLGKGSMTLQEIFNRLDTVPAHLLWRGASLLIQHKFVRLTSLKVYAHG